MGCPVLLLVDERDGGRDSEREQEQVKGGGPRVCPTQIGCRLGQRWSLKSVRFINGLTQTRDLKIHNR